MTKYTAFSSYKKRMKMKPIKVVALFIMLALSATAAAQSVDYSSLEKRFVKSKPDAQDTLAFRETGEQKVRQLFDKGRFYVENSSNHSNQAYVKRQIPDLFYVPPGDTLDVEALLNDIEQAKKTDPDAVELTTGPAVGFLGITETLNREPKFSFYLVLMQVPKKFGAEQEMVWQVFLQKPEPPTTAPKKIGKGKTGR